MEGPTLDEFEEPIVIPSLTEKFDTEVQPIIEKRDNEGVEKM